MGEIQRPCPATHARQCVAFRIDITCGRQGSRRGTAATDPKSPWPNSNRILNSSPADRSEWLDLLRRAAEDERVPQETRSEARDFLQYQETRSR